MNELRPRVEAVPRQLVETIVDQPEAQEQREVGRSLMARIQRTGLVSWKNKAGNAR